MENITQRYYEKYSEQIEWDKLTHSVLCEMTTALLNKSLKPMWDKLHSEDPMPAPLRGLLTYQTDALITLIADITALAINLLKEEIGEVDYKTYKFLDYDIKNPEE